MIYSARPASRHCSQPFQTHPERRVLVSARLPHQALSPFFPMRLRMRAVPPARSTGSLTAPDELLTRRQPPCAGGGHSARSGWLRGGYSAFGRTAARLTAKMPGNMTGNMTATDVILSEAKDLLLPCANHHRLTARSKEKGCRCSLKEHRQPLLRLRAAWPRLLCAQACLPVPRAELPAA